MTNVLYTDRIDRGFVLGNNVLAAEVFAKNGFLVLSSVTGEEQTLSPVNSESKQVNDAVPKDQTHSQPL